MARFLSKSFLTALILSVLSAPGVFAVPPASAAASASGGPSDPAEVQAFFDGALASEMASKHIPGAVISVVKDGQILFIKGYGFADLENRVPVDPQRTLFRPGSVSKLFGWSAVMQLAEQGKLNLDADVNTYLDFTIPAAFSQPITLKNLLTHTAGFEDSGGDLFKLKAEEMMPLGQYLKTHIPTRVFPPGTLGAYSNYGAALAGYIVERVSGLPFAEYIEKNFFAPLGMSHATFRQPLPDSLAADMSQGYNYAGGEYLKGSFEYVVPYPAGALSATAADLARFMVAHLQNGRYEQARILSEASALQMHSLLFQHDPRLEGMAYGFFESKINGQRVLSHGGDTLLFHSGLFLLPEQNVGVFISTNATGGGGSSSALFKLFLDRYYPVPSQPAPKPDAAFAARMAPYLGDYYSARSNFSSFEKMIRLFSPASVSLSPDGRLLITFDGETRLVTEVEPGLVRDVNHPDSRFIFRTDDQGQAYLLSDLPFAFLKTPWYATGAFNGLVLVLGLLLFLGSLLGWLIAFFNGQRKHRANPFLAGLARWVAAFFGMALLVFLFTLAGLMTDTLPAFGVPRLFFENPPGLVWMGVLPPVMAVLAALMVVFMLLAWARRYWSAGGRIHYTLLTLSAASLVWALVFWNLLL